MAIDTLSNGQTYTSNVQAYEARPHRCCAGVLVMSEVSDVMLLS